MTRPDPAALADLALETARLAAELVRGRKSAGVSVADTKTSDQSTNVKDITRFCQNVLQKCSDAIPTRFQKRRLE